MHKFQALSSRKIWNKSKLKLIAKTGFTLAEVLVTLAIIGIVAALTIPTLITGNQTKTNHIAWRKAFSSISQAIMTMTNDNGGSLANMFQTTDCSKLRTSLKNYFKYVRIDTQDVNAANRTWASVYYAYNETDVMGGPSTGPGSVCAWWVLADGTAFKVFDPQPCTTPTATCFYIMIDVNGPIKKPNALGKDIYQMQVYSNGLVKPRGWDYDATYINTGWNGFNNSPGGGWGCSAKFLISDE